MAQRVEIPEIVDKTGSVQGVSGMVTARVVGAGLSVQVNVRGSGAATVYQAATGAPTHSNPLTTDASGRIDGWVDEGSYDLVVSGAGITTYTQRFEAVAGASLVSVESGRVGPAFAIPNASVATDQTSAIQAVIDGSGEARIPGDGDYRVDGTLELGSDEQLEVERGARLLRQAAAAATTPLVWLKGANYSRLLGQGQIKTEKVAPDGIVKVGAATVEDLMNVQRWKVHDLVLVGSAAGTGNVGLKVVSGELPGTGGSNYLGSVRDIDIQLVSTGIELGQLCNAHEIAGVNMHLLGQYAYHLKGGSTAAKAIAENSIFGGFIHAKASIFGHAGAQTNITIFKGERALNHEIVGVKAEPDDAGAPGSKLVDFDANCADNMVLCRANMETVAQVADLGTNNLILDKRSLKVAQIDARRGSAAVTVLGSAPTDAYFTGIGITPIPGMLVFDATNLRFYCRDSTTWRQSGVFT